MCNLHTLHPRRVLLLCGGKSDEHEVSLASARSVLGALSGRDDLGLEVTPLVISREGALLEPGVSRALLDGVANAGDTSRTDAISIGAATALGGAGGTAALTAAAATEAALGPAIGAKGREFDVVFPLLHGPFGEDGRLQGLLDVLGLRYVGAGVLSSAVGMDKLTMKAVFAGGGLPQVEYFGVTRSQWRRAPDEVRTKAAALGFPLFVKPANLGSSIGISRVDDLAAFDDALALALEFDRRAVVESAATGARELEIAVLGNDDPAFSPVGEITHRGEFYDYATKYQDGMAELVIPAPVGSEVAQRCVELARAAYAAIDGAGLARVDMFYLPDGRLLLNEINTMPGFTAHSMYPKLWEAGGLPYPDLVRRLVDLALDDRRS